MPSLKIDIIVDDKGRPIIDRTSASMKELAASTKQADAAIQRKSSSSASLATSLLKLYAAFYLVKQGIEGVTGLLMQGVNAIDKYNLSVAKMAAMMTGMMVPNGKSLAEQYKDAYAYAGQLNVMIEDVDKNTLLTAADLRQITEEMLKQGVVVDTNNKKQIEAFTSISNALAVIAAGAPNKEIQLRQEIRALLSGQLRDTDQLSKMLNAQTGDLKKQLETHRQQGDLIEWLGEQLRGFAAAQGDINASWEATKTSLETIYERILRAGFQVAFKDINQSAKDLSEWAINHKQEIADILNEGWIGIRDAIKDIVGIFKPWEKELKVILGLIGSIFKGVARGIEFTKYLSEGFKDAMDRGASTPIGAGLYAFKYGLGRMQEGEQLRHYNLVMKLAGEGAAAKETAAAGSGKPDLKRPPGDKSGADKYANALRSITDETQAWKYRVSELNPDLEKQDSEILKLTNDAEALMKRVRDQAAKVGINASPFIAQIQAGLEQGTEYLINKEKKKLHEEYEKLLSDEVEYGMSENERAANAIIHKEEEKIQKIAEMWAADAITEKEFRDAEVKIHANAAAAILDKETENAKKIADIEYGLIQDIAGMHTWAYELRLKQIDAEAKKHEKDGVDKKAIAVWKEYQQQLAVIQKAISGYDYSAGYRAQLDKYVLDMKTAGQYGAEAFMGETASMKESFADLFNDITSGELASWEDYFTSFCNKMNAVWNDMLAEMLANWIMTGNAMKGTSSATSTAGGFLGMLGSVFGLGGSSSSTIAHELATVAHGGGIIGSDSFASRSVPGYVFAGAPKYHKGNEYPAILERGEGVFTKKQMQALGMGGGGDINSTIINISALDSQSFNDAVKRNPTAITTVVNEALKNNSGLRNTIKRTR